MTNLEGILKSRDITLLTKVCLVKAMVFPLLVFPVIMQGCESWTIKKADKDHIKTIKKGEELMFLNCGVGELEIPSSSARRSNQSILKEISPEKSLEGLMLKLKLQYIGHLMQRDDSLEKTLVLGKPEGRRRRG